MEWTDRDALIALNSVEGIGPATIRAAVEAAGSARAFAEAPERYGPLLGKRAMGLSTAGLAARLERERELLAQTDAAVLTQADAAYPGELEHLDHPPPVLYLRGETAALEEHRLRIAIVGARACNQYGRNQAEHIGSGLAVAGAVVASGGARGIDRAAMEGAEQVGGKVIAVLGSAVDRPYPPEAARFFDHLAANAGLIISEFPLGTAPTRQSFPRRNRVLAGLCRGVVVVQATEKSGSMITAGWALELGREVFAVPGEVDQGVSRGPLALLRQGAAVAAGPQDVLAAFQTTADPPECDDEPPVLACLADGDRSLDAIAAQTGIRPDELQLELVEYELKGLVMRRPGGLYHRSGPCAAR